MGWVKGLEPSTPGTTIRCSNQLSYTHHIYILGIDNIFLRRVNGTPEGTRTPGLLLRRQLLYPTELLAHIVMQPHKDIEPNSNLGRIQFGQGVLSFVHCYLTVPGMVPAEGIPRHS